jgi:hypothetical protein
MTKFGSGAWNVSSMAFSASAYLPIMQLHSKFISDHKEFLSQYSILVLFYLLPEAMILKWLQCLCNLAMNLADNSLATHITG